jgi:hypothetical protein
LEFGGAERQAVHHRRGQTSVAAHPEGGEALADHPARVEPHRGLALAIPLAETQDPMPVRPRDVRCRDLLGGLIHEYHGVAA